jgi:hypothetical protein
LKRSGLHVVGEQSGDEAVVVLPAELREKLAMVFDEIMEFRVM